MTEIKRDFQVIEGMPEEVDWVHLLEEMDARDAIPILRQMSRQRSRQQIPRLQLLNQTRRQQARKIRASKARTNQFDEEQT
jgi:hypothetical protein